MKKFLLISLAVLIIGCGNDNSSNGQGNVAEFTKAEAVDYIESVLPQGLIEKGVESAARPEIESVSVDFGEETGAAPIVRVTLVSDSGVFMTKGTLDAWADALGVGSLIVASLPDGEDGLSRLLVILDSINIGLIEGI